jgi:hypothetical protein
MTEQVLSAALLVSWTSSSWVPKPAPVPPGSTPSLDADLWRAMAQHDQQQCLGLKPLRIEPRVRGLRVVPWAPSGGCGHSCSGSPTAAGLDAPPHNMTCTGPCGRACVNNSTFNNMGQQHQQQSTLGCQVAPALFTVPAIQPSLFTIPAPVSSGFNGSHCGCCDRFEEEEEDNDDALLLPLPPIHLFSTASSSTGGRAAGQRDLEEDSAGSSTWGPLAVERCGNASTVGCAEHSGVGVRGGVTDVGLERWAMSPPPVPDNLRPHAHALAANSAPSLLLQRRGRGPRSARRCHLAAGVASGGQGAGVLASLEAPHNHALHVPRHQRGSDPARLPHARLPRGVAAVLNSCSPSVARLPGDLQLHGRWCDITPRCASIAAGMARARRLVKRLVGCCYCCIAPRASGRSSSPQGMGGRNFQRKRGRGVSRPGALLGTMGPKAGVSAAAPLLVG